MLLFSSAYNEYTVISKEYTGPLYFDITGVDCSIQYLLEMSPGVLLTRLYSISVCLFVCF